MMLLIAGILLWSLIHFSRTIAPKFRQNLIHRFGLQGYKGLFSVIVLIALVLMVFGWKQTDATPLYTLPTYTRHMSALLMLLATVLFFSGWLPTNIKRTMRHPQLTSVVVWSVAHLISNGEWRSVILFVGLGVWAVAQWLLINHREGVWHKPEKFSTSGDVALFIVSVAVYSIFVLFLHQYLFGVRPY